jgi:hypothetical protein
MPTAPSGGADIVMQGALDWHEAAAHCGFTVATFRAWVRCGLMPPPASPLRGWARELLNNVLATLTRYGWAPAQDAKTPARLPNVHRLKRRLVDDRYRDHLRHRKTGQKLPGPLGSPQCMAALIECERRLSREFITKQHSIVPGTPAASCAVVDEKVSKSERRQKSNGCDLTNSADELRYLTPEEVSSRWREKITTETLANWRAMQIGPPYNKFGKAILYRLDLLEKWERQTLVSCDLSESSIVTDREGCNCKR